MKSASLSVGAGIDDRVHHASNNETHLIHVVYAWAGRGNAQVVVWRRSAWVGEETFTGELKYFLCAKFYTCICGVARSASPQRETERNRERERE